MSPPNRPPSIATPTESESTDRSSTGRRLTRRTFVAAGSTTALVSLAGCSAVVDFLGDLALQDVNVFNGADQSVSGSIEVVDPNDETVLEETFDLEEESGDDEQDDEATAQYDDVWTDAGDYEVTVTLDEPIDGAGSEDDENQNESNENETDSSGNETDADLEADSGDVDSDAAEDAENETAENETAENETDSDDSPVGPSRTDTVTVDDTEEQNLVIGIAQDGPAELISYHVIEELSDLEDEFEE